MTREPAPPLGGAPVKFRTTPVQWLALALLCLVAVPALMYGVYLGAGEVAGPGPFRDIVRVIAALYSLLLTVRLAARLIAKGGKGIDADRVGIRPAARKAARLAPWPAITDIRVRRSPLRRRVVVYVDRGARWWLPVPYSGLLLARDGRFDEKVRTLREMWEANRYGPEGAPGPREPSRAGGLAHAADRAGTGPRTGAGEPAARDTAAFPPPPEPAGPPGHPWPGAPGHPGAGAPPGPPYGPPPAPTRSPYAPPPEPAAPGTPAAPVAAPSPPPPPPDGKPRSRGRHRRLPG